MFSALSRKALAAVWCCAMGLLFFSGCGKDEPNSGTTARGTPTAGSGRGVLSGVVNVVSGGCNTTSGILVTVNTLPGNNVYTYLAPLGTNFEAQIPPGEYTLNCQAIPCVFTQNFTINAGQSLVIDPVL